MKPIGQKLWVIPEGYIPPTSMPGADSALESHETACILNAGDAPASIEITLYFEDRDPVGPYRLKVDARRTHHQRFNDLTDPERVPRGTSYASVIRSDVPIVVQHTRLDSRASEIALMTTLAHPAD